MQYKIVASMGITKDFNSIKWSNEIDNSLASTGCLSSTLGEIMFFKKIDPYFYYGDIVGSHLGSLFIPH